MVCSTAGWWTAVGTGFLYFWRQNELQWGPGTLVQKSASVASCALTLVIANGGLGIGRGEAADVKLLTSALGNVAGQKWAIRFDRLHGGRNQSWIEFWHKNGG